MAAVSDYVRLGAVHVPRRVAVVEERSGRQLTYSDLEELTARIALGLRGLGLEPGDRFACLLSTSLEYLVLYLACARSGLVVVPVNVLLHPDEIRHVLDDSGAKAIAVDTGTSDAADAAGAIGQLPSVLVGGVAADVERGMVRYDDLARAEGDALTVAVEADDLLALGFTSGTTGFPKAAELTHGGVMAMNRTNAIAYRLPMASCGAYAGNMSFSASVPAFILTHLALSGTVVLAADNDPAAVVQTIGRYGCNYTAVPPPLVGPWAAAASEHPESLHSLRSVLQGAGRANFDHLVRLNEVLDGRVVTSWGMTEASGGLVSALSPADSMAAVGDPQRLGTVGHPLPGFEVRIHPVEEEDDPAEGLRADDGIGELVVRSPSMVRAYWRRPEATATSMGNGWYRTGDLGRFDPEGRIILVDRRNDLIVSGGMNVYPSEVERVLQRMPGIVDSVVIGVPHPRWGRSVAAVVVTEDPSMTAETVIDWCRASLASYKKPTEVLFRDSLPRTVSGKVKRNELERQVQGQVGG